MAEVRTQNVKKLTKFGYGNGHVLNDVCASMWFSYLLLYFHNVIQLDNFHAGLIILVGQIADGIFTILVGVLLDRKINFWICNKYGTRKVKFKIILILMLNINYIIIFAKNEKFMQLCLCIILVMACAWDSMHPGELPFSIFTSSWFHHWTG